MRDLWFARVFTAIGDEFTSFAIVIILASTLSNNSGLVLSIQSYAIIASGILLAPLAYKTNRQRLLSTLDLLRVVFVLIPVVAISISTSYLLPSVLFCIISVYILRPVFEPTIQAVIPSVVSSSSEILVANGLFDSVRRLARIIGPALAGLLILIVNPSDLFVFSAIGYIFSAVLILRKKWPKDAVYAKDSFQSKKNAMNGFRQLAQDSTMCFHVTAHALQSGAWYLGFIIALSLLPKYNHNFTYHDFGVALSVYGIGNLLSNFIVSEKINTMKLWILSLGRIVSSVGFLMIFESDTPYMLYLSCAIAAVGAPITEIPLVTLMQTRFSSSAISDVYRSTMILEALATIIILTISPLIISNFGVRGAILVTCFVYLSVSIFGFVFFTKENKND